MRYTEFEATFLVATYLVGEQINKEIVAVGEIFTRFPMDVDDRWVRRALVSFTENGWAKNRLHSGDMDSQYNYLTAAGLREAERLLDSGEVSIRLPDEIAPASDRIVSLKDNQQATAAAQETIAHLALQLARGNDLGAMRDEEIAEARREVWALEQIFRQEAVRVDWVYPLAENILKWIAKLTAEQLVGTLALAALTTIAVALGLAT